MWHRSCRIRHEYGRMPRQVNTYSKSIYCLQGKGESHSSYHTSVLLHKTYQKNYFSEQQYHFQMSKSSNNDLFIHFPVSFRNSDSQRLTVFTFLSSFLSWREMNLPSPLSSPTLHCPPSVWSPRRSRRTCTPASTLRGPRLDRDTSRQRTLCWRWLTTSPRFLCWHLRRTLRWTVKKSSGKRPSAWRKAGVRKNLEDYWGAFLLLQMWILPLWLSALLAAVFGLWILRKTCFRLDSLWDRSHQRTMRTWSLPLWSYRSAR